MSAAAPLWLLLIQERVTLIQQAPGAQKAADLALPSGTATLRLHGEPPTPLQIEHKPIVNHDWKSIKPL